MESYTLMLNSLNSKNRTINTAGGQITYYIDWGAFLPRHNKFDVTSSIKSAVSVANSNLNLNVNVIVTLGSSQTHINGNAIVSNISHLVPYTYSIGGTNTRTYFETRLNENYHTQISYPSYNYVTVTTTTGNMADTAPGTVFPDYILMLRFTPIEE